MTAETAIAPDNQSMGSGVSQHDRRDLDGKETTKVAEKLNGRDYHTKTISYRFNEMQFLIVRSTGGAVHTHKHGKHITLHTSMLDSKAATSSQVRGKFIACTCLIKSSLTDAGQKARRIYKLISNQSKRDPFCRWPPFRQRLHLVDRTKQRHIINSILYYIILLYYTCLK